MSPDEFRQLLEALRTEVPADFVVRLAECDRLGQPVATPIRRENYWRADADRHFAKEEAGMPSLIVEPRPTYGVGEGFDALEAALWRLLQLPLQEGRLSYRSGGYRALCDEDLEFVRAATSLDLGHEV